MALSWNEIKDRAVAFSKEWQDTTREEAEAKPFLIEFFNVFGVNRKKVATFEEPVKKLNDASGYIDLFWKAMILVEMKSKGKDLDKAYSQAMEYLQRVPQHELPKYVLVCDFDTFRLTDMEEEKTVTFRLKDLVKNVQHFGLIAGYQKRTYKEQDPVNIHAAELMGKLHDKLEAIGYTGHALEVYLVRVLFCLFADDTGIFEPVGLFDDFIRDRTADDGSDLAPRLSELFQVLNTSQEKRLKNLDEQLATFPYVNGKLFEEHLPHASFDRQMRMTLLECCTLNWGKISPAIFGSMFQAVMNPQERRNLGAHYTSEKNILKVIKPLFLDALHAEFNAVKSNAKRLNEFHKKLSTLTFLDPACGCGNFLVITYRELRLLELEVLRQLHKSGQGALDVREILWIDVDQFHGIEYEEFPARIAEVAMWLIDHQMNMAVSEEFGQYFVRLPLKKSANIIHGNALRTDWETVVSKDKLSFIFGNPPFIGKAMQNDEQKADMEKIFGDVKGAGVLDYVTAWYVTAARCIQGTKIKVAFVSTNSIAQGEQTGILWSLLFNQYQIKIHFAHRTFSWTNEAKGNAAVHVVIIGFANFDSDTKTIYEYTDIKGEPHEVKAKTINGYLLDAKEIVISKRRVPISNVPEMAFGNMPNDGGNFLFEEVEMMEFLEKEPNAKKFFRKFIGAEEFISGKCRWCLWLKDAEPNELSKLPEVSKRTDLVRQARLNSARPTTQKLAAFPTLFGEIRQPQSDYIVFPEVSSERRRYVPVGFMSKDVITSNKNYTIANGSLYLFGILSSSMHMAWVRQVAGRMKSDISYSTGIVYNNFPFPEHPTEKQIATIENAVRGLLDARVLFPDASLADLYDPLSMPAELTKAHQALDKAVDQAYRTKPFDTEAKRMEFLFDLYEKYTAGLFAQDKVRKTKKVKHAADANKND